LLLCVNDTPQNGCWECTVRTLTSGVRMAFLDGEELRCFQVDRIARREYQEWKTRTAHADWPRFVRLSEELHAGVRSPHASFAPLDDDGFAEVA
jgi:hypothetical protein